jgi:hypothetical protein
VESDKTFQYLRVNANQGVSTAHTEVDNLVRQIPLLMQTPDGWVASFGTEVLKALAQQKLTSSKVLKQELKKYLLGEYRQPS